MAIYPTARDINEDGHVTLNGIDLVDLLNTYGSPLYVIDHDTLIHNARQYAETLKARYPNHLIAYAGKACLNLGLINYLSKEGLGLDVVSGGELFTALKSKIQPESVIFHGNNKSTQELELAIKHHVRLVVDNAQEFTNILSIAERIGQHPIILFRVKPQIEADTHAYIKTGHDDSKFGLIGDELWSLVSTAILSDSIDFRGFHSHIGSQLSDPAVFVDLVEKMLRILRRVKDDFDHDVKELNLGGGIGIQYVASETAPNVAEILTGMVDRLQSGCDKLGLKHPKLIVEPGRSIIGNAGVTLYTVGTLKRVSENKQYVFVDGGMADNPRPLLYQSQYTIELANKATAQSTDTYSIAGKFCESGDILAEDIRLPMTEVGDVVIFYGTGAYNYSMASNYNRYCRPAMVAVRNGKVETLVRRETYEDLMQYDEAVT